MYHVPAVLPEFLIGLGRGTKWKRFPNGGSTIVFMKSRVSSFYSFSNELRTILGMLLLQRALSRSKALWNRSTQTPSRSLSSPSHSEDIEKLFQYTRGRWLYNEREREYTPSHLFFFDI